jgi:acetyl esterase/lipase
VIYDAALDLLIEEQRAAQAALAGAPPPAPAFVLPAEDWVLPGQAPLKLRIIRPPGAIRAAMPHLHAGGFTSGNPAMADGGNSELSRAAGLVTVSVDYRLAPEHPHPAALEDCLRAALWLIGSAKAQFGTGQLLIGGESVGASLAVLTLLRLRDQHAAARAFLGANLALGNYDFSGTPSQRHATPALFLSPERLRATVAAAFPGRDPEQLREPGISSLYALLADLPPAIFTVGTQDSVLDDSLFMARRWQAAGNRAELALYPEATHLFMLLHTRMAAEARRRIVAFLRGCLESEPATLQV